MTFYGLHCFKIVVGFVIQNMLQIDEDPIRLSNYAVLMLLDDTFNNVN